jgi:hypothetical protein
MSNMLLLHKPVLCFARRHQQLLLVVLIQNPSFTAHLYSNLLLQPGKLYRYVTVTMLAHMPATVVAGALATPILQCTPAAATSCCCYKIPFRHCAYLPASAYVCTHTAIHTYHIDLLVLPQIPYPAFRFNHQQVPTAST